MSISPKQKRLMIGIPAFNGILPESAPDYMRFMYYLGRECTELYCFLAVVPKLEQYRARNEIVKAALQTGCHYLLMIDDDHIIDIDDGALPSQRYDFARKLIAHLEENPKIGLVGALYYQRHGLCHPVLMRKGPDGKYYWFKDEDIEHKLQKVDVAGGGCMMINCKVFDRIGDPWFEPESTANLGTDLQIAEKIRNAGWEVWADTSIELGHVATKKDVVTSKNRHKQVDCTNRYVSQVEDDWNVASCLMLYNGDIEEYLNMSLSEVAKLAEKYGKNGLYITQFDNPEDYYRALGPEQLARQFVFHNKPGYGTSIFLNNLISLTNGKKIKILDFGCGSSPIGFEMALQGHEVDFVDIDGAPAYEFTKWRCKKRLPQERYNFFIDGPYDVILALDSIEHCQDGGEKLRQLSRKLKPKGYLVTNFFHNEDFANPEHLYMNKKEAKTILIDNDLYPSKETAIWQKLNLS